MGGLWTVPPTPQRVKEGIVSEAIGPASTVYPQGEPSLPRETAAGHFLQPSTQHRVRSQGIGNGEGTFFEKGQEILESKRMKQYELAGPGEAVLQTR